MLTFLLIIVYIVIYYFLLKSIRWIFKKTQDEPTVVNRALISSMIIVLVFITAGLIYILLSMPKHALAGVGLIFLPFYAVYVGIGGFAISWSIITLIFFSSAKHRSGVPKKTLFFHTILAILVLVIISVSTYVFVSRQLILQEAESPKISQTSLEEIYTKAMRRHDTEMLQRLAQNPQTPVLILEEIYISYPQDLNNGIFYSLAMNRNTPGEILEKLAKSKWDFVRNAVAKNPNTPVEVLRILAEDRYYLVRVSVANNINTPRDVLVKLSSDPYPLVSGHARNRSPELE